METVGSISGFQCEICSKRFNRKDQFKVHYNQHLNKKKKCQSYGKKFHPMSLARHQKSNACNRKQVHPKQTGMVVEK